MGWVHAVALISSCVALCGTAQAQYTSRSILLAAADTQVSAGGTMFKPLPSPSQHLTVQLPGMSHHFDQPLDEDGQPMPGRRFNERNWGIGVQLERNLAGDWAGWVGKTSLGLMKDSLDAMGLYAGHTWQKRLLDDGPYTLDAGAGVFAFYRTLSFDGPHVLVPAALPVLSATQTRWGLGVNIVAVPRVKLSNGTMPGVIYAQFTKGY